MQRAIVIIGGFSTSSGHYRKMAAHLEQMSNLSVRVVPIKMSEWTGVARLSGWRNLLQKLENTILETQSATDSEKIIVIAHSLGGIVTRLYLTGPSAIGFQAEHSSAIEYVVTLGTPHKRGIVKTLTVWKGLSECLAQKEVPVPLLSVAGSVDYSGRGSVLKSVVRLRYQLHGGNPGELGDGIIPIGSAVFDPDQMLIVENARHDFRIGHPWYGDLEIIERWWGEVERRLNSPDRCT
jgi:hypothetical protein